MSVSFELPRELEEALRDELGDLGQAAKEALLVDLYQREKLTHRQFGDVLGLTRFEADAVLKRHGMYYDLSAADVARESEGLRKLRDEHADRR